MDSYNLALEIVKKLVSHGYTAYFAGGWVRDYLMNHPSSDIDIATDAPPQVILDLFPYTILVGLSFGVVVVVIKGHQFEVATFRKDISYADGRKPEKIEFTSAKEDAIRRDFTINGMFYDPLEGVVHDFVEGVADIHKGVIRAIGDPQQRFMEDRLRMIRAIRFACRFDFLIDLETQEAIQENANTLYPPVAKERVWNELTKMAAYPRFEHGLIEMHRLGLLPVIFPQLVSVHLHEIKKRISHLSHFPAKCPAIVCLLELFPDLALSEKIEIFSGLHVSNQELKYVESSHLAKDLFQKETVGSSIESVVWAHFYAHPHVELLIQAEAARRLPDDAKAFLFHHQLRCETLDLHIQRIKNKKPLVTSEHLQKAGINPGKQMGILLKEAERQAVNQDSNDHAAVLHLLKQTPLWKI
jgi:poly(A) polymerase